MEMSFARRLSSIQPPMAALNTDSLNTDSTPVQYTFNSKIMVAAMVILFIVVFFVVSLHVYAKWFWRQPIPFADRRMAMSWRRRHRHENDQPFVSAGDTNIHSGLDKSIRDTLPTFSYKPSANVEEGTLLECAVCLSEFQENEKGRLLPLCKHSFHIECIDMWFTSHSTCPLCRAAVFVMPTAKSTSMEASRSGGMALVSGNNGHIEQGGEFHSTEMAQAPAAEGRITPMPLSPSGVVPPPHHVLLLWNQHHLSFQLSSPCIGGHASYSTRSLPSSSVDMVARHPINGGRVARCVSLSMSRYPSSSTAVVVDDDQGCSSSRPAISKSASARNPIKWLLRREMSKGKSRVFPSSSHGSVDLDQYSCPSTSNSLPL